MACFGGAGGQHACSIARSLGIKRIHINKFSGILSAYGLSKADVVCEKQEPCNMKLNNESMSNYILARLEHLKQECIKYLIEKEGFNNELIEVEAFLNLRYKGTDSCIMCPPLINEKVLEFSALNYNHFEKSFIKT